MDVDEKKLERLYGVLDTYSFKSVLGGLGYTSTNNQYNCVGHDEKIPSLFVNEELGVWHCMSCGRHGKIGSLIAYYYEKQRNIKNYYIALETYIKENEELGKELGFFILRCQSNKSKSLTTAEVLKLAESRIKSKVQIETLKINYKLNKNEKDINKILKYIINLQNNGGIYNDRKD